jgi:hypothetical protein
VKVTGAILALCLAAAPACAEEPWGWELPDFGKDTRIVGLYRSAKGAMVVELAHVDLKSQRTYFYDTALKERLTPKLSQQITDRRSEERVVNANHLTPINRHMAVNNSAGTSFALKDLSGGKCEWPYDVALTVETKRLVWREYLILQKLPKPETGHYGCSYAGSPGALALRTRYRAQEPDLYWSSGPNVYYALHDLPYLVRFDASGNTHFFDHRKDVMMIDASMIGPIVGKMESAGNRDQAQTLVEKAETVMDVAQARHAQ